MNQIDMSTWSDNWMWSLPLIAVVVVFHTFCLGRLNHRIKRAMSNVGKHRVPELVAMRVIGVAVLSVTLSSVSQRVFWWMTGNPSVIR